MKRAVLILVGAAVVLSLAALAQRRAGRAESSGLPMPKTSAEKKIVAALARIAGSKETYLNVPVADGKLLRLLTESAGAKNVVEVGTSTGYSGLWLCLALEATGGHLTTFEIDPRRAAQARQHFAEAGVEDLVTIIEGDAHQTLKRWRDPIDLAFIDADKARLSRLPEPASPSASAGRADSGPQHRYGPRLRPGRDGQPESGDSDLPGGSGNGGHTEEALKSGAGAELTMEPPRGPHAYQVGDFT